MAEAILLILWVGTTIFLGCKIERERKDRESHEWWLSNVKESIYSIESEFRWRCQEIAEEESSNLRFNKYNYSIRISELEKTYKETFTEKVVAQKRVHITTIPEHLVREYNSHISDTADTFRHLGTYITNREEK